MMPIEDQTAERRQAAKPNPVAIGKLGETLMLNDLEIVKPAGDDCKYDGDKDRQPGHPQLEPRHCLILARRTKLHVSQRLPDLLSSRRPVASNPSTFLPRAIAAKTSGAKSALTAAWPNNVRISAGLPVRPASPELIAMLPRSLMITPTNTATTPTITLVTSSCVDSSYASRKTRVIMKALRPICVPEKASIA